jgi:hypothetical protein
MPRDDRKVAMPRRPRAPGAPAAARDAVLQAQVALVRVQTELRTLELARRQQTLVERAAAEATVEATAQRHRTYWLKWPAQAAPALAERFGLEADAVADVLAGLVRAALSELAHAERRAR